MILAKTFSSASTAVPLRSTKSAMLVPSTIALFLCLIHRSVAWTDGPVLGAPGLSGLYMYHHQTLCGKLDLRTPPRDFGPSSPKLQYYMLENGKVSRTASFIDVSVEGAVMPAALYCVQSFKADNFRKAGQLVCVNDPNDWVDECVKTHCIIEESPGRITFDCDVAVKRGNYLDPKCDNGRLTSPIDSPGRRRTVSYYMYGDPKEILFNGKHGKDFRTTFEARKLQYLLCVLGPASNQKNDAPHVHWVCVTDMSRWSKCITHYCQFEEELDYSGDYVYVPRCGRTAPGALSSKCYGGRYIPAPPDQQSITGRLNYFLKDDGQAYQVDPEFKTVPLPGFLYCLLGPLPYESDTAAKSHWVCTEDPNEWNNCVGTVCTFLHLGKTIVVNCQNVRQLKRGNLLDPHCDGGRFTVPAVHASIDTFKYVIYNEDKIYQVNADSEDLSYQSLLCVLGPHPGEKNDAPHSLWVCTLDPRVWPSCIDRHCRFKRRYKAMSVFDSYTLYVDCGYPTSELINYGCYRGRFHMPLAYQFANTKTLAYYDFDYSGGKLITLDAAKDSLPPYLWCVRGPKPGRPVTDKESVWNCVTDLERGFVPCITTACHIRILLRNDERQFEYNCGTPTAEYRLNLVQPKPVCANNRFYVPAYGSPFDTYSFIAIWESINSLPRTATGQESGIIGYCVLVAENAKPKTPRNRWFCIADPVNFSALYPCVKFACQVSRTLVEKKFRYSYNCGVKLPTAGT